LKILQGEDPEDVIIKAALASARDTDDVIDNAMHENIEDDRKRELENYTILGTFYKCLFNILPTLKKLINSFCDSLIHFILKFICSFVSGIRIQAV
jgi:hypothetical protein